MIPDTPQTLLRKIAEYAKGDDAAEWSRFVELYTPVIRAFICAREDIGEADADDAVQEIIVRLVGRGTCPFANHAGRPHGGGLPGLCAQRRTGR